MGWGPYPDLLSRGCLQLGRGRGSRLCEASADFCQQCPGDTTVRAGRAVAEDGGFHTVQE